MTDQVDQQEATPTERETSCYEKAKALGEVTFTLRARDPFAAFLVRQWVQLAYSAGVPVPKVMDAEITARQMEQWPEKKIPD